MMERISIDTNGFGWTGASGRSSLSADGRYVVLETVALEDPIDSGQRTDIYIVDRMDGSYRMLTVDMNGDDANGSALYPILSADGSFLAYSSTASDLLVGQSDGISHVVVQDLSDDSFDFVSTPIGTVNGNGAGDLFYGGMSGDARYVGFTYEGSDLSPADLGAGHDVYLTDRTNNTIELISVNSAEVKGNSYSIGGSVSDDGRFVTFYSGSTNLDAADSNGAQADVFIRDTVAGTTSVITAGGNSYSYHNKISADGAYVVFASDASNLVAGDLNGKRDLFLWERASGTTVRIETGFVNYDTDFDISDDGRFVVFVSEDASLVPGDTNGFADVYVYDRVSGLTQRISVSDGGAEGNSDSTRPTISGDGSVISFQSQANNLTVQPTDSSEWSDVYLVENPFYVAPAGPIVGTDGDDVLEGTGNDDVIQGLKGKDVLNGKGGDDDLDGGSGRDILDGGAGIDTLNGGGGRDLLKGRSGADHLTGKAGNDKLLGGGGDDFLSGGEGADSLSGGRNNDILKGGAGVDVLNGGSGRDLINGGTGDDLLTGGTAKDVFVFADGDGHDIITDFNYRADKIQITSGAANFGELTISQQISDVLVAFGSVEILIEGLDVANLNANDFIF